MPNNRGNSMGRHAFTLILVICFAVGAMPCLHAEHNAMELPPEVRQWFYNFTRPGSCVQCSISICGAWCGDENASTLLWDTHYGPAIHHGSSPPRVAAYARSRDMKLFNITGNSTLEWMRWASKTGRFAAIGAGGSHFQTLYGYDDNNTPSDFDDDVWEVCNNNSPKKIDRYSDKDFRRLHYASGKWIVVLDTPGQPMKPQYRKWW